MPGSVIAPEEPISLALAKQHLRIIDNSSEDLLIQGHISAARRHVENIIQTVLTRRQFTEHLPLTSCAWLELGNAPVVSIDSVSYVDAEGTEQEYANPRLTTWHRPARLHPAIGGTWPAAESLRVTYTAGVANGEVEPDLIAAMLLLIGHFHVNREAATGGAVVSEIQRGVEALCQPHRRWR